jgi:hypothetical protein
MKMVGLLARTSWQMASLLCGRAYAGQPGCGLVALAFELWETVLAIRLVQMLLYANHHIHTARQISGDSLRRLRRRSDRIQW